MDMMTARNAANMAKRELTESGGVGYTETNIVCSTTLEPFDGVKSTASVEILDLTIGKIYTVKMDSGSYSTICKEGVGGLPALGNLGLLNNMSEDTGESFLIEAGHECYVIYDFNKGNSCTILEETTYPIDPKHLNIKTIDLDQFGIGESILILFGQGGGYHAAAHPEGFWESLGNDLNADIRMFFRYGRITLEIRGVSVAYDDAGDWMQLSGSLLTMVDDYSNVPVINVAIIHVGDTTVVSVRVS